MKNIVFILLAFVFFSCAKEEFSDPELQGVVRDSSLVSVSNNGIELNYNKSFGYYNDNSSVNGKFWRYVPSSYYSYNSGYGEDFDFRASYYRINGNNLEIYLVQDNLFYTSDIEYNLYTNTVKIVIPKSDLKVNNEVFLRKSIYNSKNTNYAEFKFVKKDNDSYYGYSTMNDFVITTIGKIMITDIDLENKTIQCITHIYYSNYYEIAGNFKSSEI